MSERSNSHANVPVSLAPAKAAKYDRVQDGPEAYFNRCSMGFDQRLVCKPFSVARRRAASG